jgi:hypothetical protein
MEALTMFASAVGTVAVIHLLSITVERFGRGKYNRESQQAERQDWYCFFQPSDLTGITGSTAGQQQTMNDDSRLEQRRRRQANRPRLQA